MENTLHLKIRKDLLPLFFYLFQKGVLLKILAGENVRDLLFNRLGISDDYMENRIQTVFLNGKAVDDLRKTVVPDGATLALSAAMPGLAGATLRRGGTFASFRQAITVEPEKETIVPKEGVVTLKLFNLLVSELAPSLLARGIWLKGEDLTHLLGTLKISQAGGNPEGSSGFSKEDLVFLNASIE
ncbi:MAG TPA: hypothetical protein VK564_04510 [Thermodesulfobacteriota bacterium]|nr:hypothetical protein [Thermodesulfobacteriota bacterium]